MLGGKKIHVNENNGISRSVVTLSRGARREEKMRHARIYSSLYEHVRSIRVFNSAALDICYTACGRFDAHIDSDCDFHDYIAGTLIASEAGATVTDFSGRQLEMKKTDFFIANSSLHGKFLEILRDK